MKSTPPIQIVKEHCDCYNDGACLGITCDDKLRPVRFQKEGSPCLLASTPMQRCQHFESSIMPMEKRTEWARDARVSARLATEFRQGAHEYRIRTGFMSETVRLCPQCRSSKIGSGRKLCDQCKARNRRETKSTSDRIKHAESSSHSSSISGIDNQ